MSVVKFELSDNTDATKIIKFPPEWLVGGFWSFDGFKDGAEYVVRVNGSTVTVEAK